MHSIFNSIFSFQPHQNRSACKFCLHADALFLIFTSAIPLGLHRHLPASLTKSQLEFCPQGICPDPTHARWVTSLSSFYPVLLSVGFPRRCLFTFLLMLLGWELCEVRGHVLLISMSPAPSSGHLVTHGGKQPMYRGGSCKMDQWTLEGTAAT
jgi:hypothetical protein